jgi:outer membrane usher protein
VPLIRREMKRAGLVSVVACCLAIAPAASLPADTVVAAATPARSVTMVLRVQLNTQDKGDIFVERTPDRDFLIKVQDLKAMGFKDPPGTLVMVDGEPYIALGSMRGVSYEFQEKGLSLNITADPALLSASSFVMPGRQSKARGSVAEDSSAFFNYSLTADGSSEATRKIGFAGELGWRLGDYLLLSDGSTIPTANGGRKFVRLMTSLTRDDRENLRRTIVGDFFTPSRDFSTGISLAGISVSKLYGLNPYFIQFPMQNVAGTVALPSDLEVYMDGQRIRTERLQPGAFELRDILAYGGAHNIQLVLRDSFGRTQQLSYSFYFSDQPLSKGLHEYSYNAGAIRRAFGTESDRYGPAAMSMFHRYGFSDALTLGVRAEATRDFFNGGPLASIVLGPAGVFSMGLAASSVSGREGASALASYNYQSKRWNFGASVRRQWRNYASLGDPPIVTNRKTEGSLSGSYFLQRGSVSLSHSILSTRDGMATSSATSAKPFSVSAFDSHRITSLSYSAPLVSGRATLSASLSHVREKNKNRNELFAGVIVFFDKDYSVAANYRGDRNGNSQEVRLTKTQPIGEGFGFNVSADRVSDTGGQNVRLKSDVQYNAPAAILRAEVGQTHDQAGRSNDDYRLLVAGGIGYVGKHVAFGRPITGSFGVVTVGELAGVGVSVNGQPVGKTNAQGMVFIPSLTPYFDNDVSIAPETIPIDYSISANVKTVSPSSRSGALLEFGVTKIQAFSGKLKYRKSGTVQPVEFRELSVNAEGKRLVFQTGRGGEFYLENVMPGNYGGSVDLDGKPCAFDLAIPRSSEVFVELGDLECRASP